MFIEDKIEDIFRGQQDILGLYFMGCVITALDLWLSFVFLNAGYMEGNPFMAGLLSYLAIPAFIALNVSLSIGLMTVLAYSSMNYVDKKFQHYRFLPLLMYCSIRSVAIYHNTLLL